MLLTVGAVLVFLTLAYALYRLPLFTLAVLALGGAVHHHAGVQVPAVVARIVEPVTRLQAHQEQRGHEFACGLIVLRAVREGSEERLAEAQKRCPERRVR